MKALETVTQAINKDAGVYPTNKEESWWALRVVEHPTCETLRGAIDFYRLRKKAAQTAEAQQKLSGCAPESLDYAMALSDEGNHAASAQAFQTLEAAAPLNRAAREMLVRELQLAGDDEGAQTAAADWLRVAPNAENYHRLATSLAEESPAGEEPPREFYSPYRLDAAEIGRVAISRLSANTAVTLLDDHVAISRPDGSVSVYVHNVRRVADSRDADLALPPQAQVITARVLHADGTAKAIDSRSQLPFAEIAFGDIVDQEYVLHYAGDGGIPEHPEAFQFVFGSFNRLVLHARFVVLTPAGRGDRGVVIASGDAPRMAIRLRGEMLERVWEKYTAPGTDGEALMPPTQGLAIIRLVEQENGWTVPSKAEHQRRIETIHPGPRPADS